MIKEAYVSFEVAKLLKEKGFDEKCQKVYLDNGKLMWFTNFMEGESFGDNADINTAINYDNSITSAYLCPTHQMAMKWLRVVHNIDIEVHADVGMLGVKVYTPFISRYKSSTEYPSKLKQYKNGLYFEDDRGVIPGIRHFETYEEAVEVALKYSLENLI